MAQAAVDDFGAAPPFNYAIVGHDVDQNGLDGTAKSACCQCYQLVYSLPENEARVNGSGASAIAIPKPVIVQAFNTSAGGGQNFDLFMGAGGFGSFNACDPAFSSMKSPSGLYLYSSFPEQGEPGSGGVNAATQLAGCKTNENLVTAATLSSATCVANMQSACMSFASSTLTPQAVADSIQSCTKSNDAASYYHLNWEVYAKKIECPTHLTQVTGCKLAPQGLPAANPNVTTPAQAAADSSFKATTSNGTHYTTTTMQDCCKPTCAWQDWVTGSNGGLTAVGQYNSFYSCNQTGVPGDRSNRTATASTAIANPHQPAPQFRHPQEHLPRALRPDRPRRRLRLRHALPVPGPRDRDTRATSRASTWTPTAPTR